MSNVGLQPPKGESSLGGPPKNLHLSITTTIFNHHNYLQSSGSSFLFFLSFQRAVYSPRPSVQRYVKHDFNFMLYFVGRMKKWKGREGRRNGGGMRWERNGDLSPFVWLNKQEAKKGRKSIPFFEGTKVEKGAFSSFNRPLLDAFDFVGLEERGIPPLFRHLIHPTKQVILRLPFPTLLPSRFPLTGHIVKSMVSHIHKIE